MKNVGSRRLAAFGPRAGLALVVAIALAALLPACGRDDHQPAESLLTAPNVNPDKSLQTHLAAAWSDGEAYDYDTVSGTIAIATGGSFMGHPASYPTGFAVSVSVPAGAVPEEYAVDGEITITVKVPVNGTTFASADDPCPVVLEPDGVQFRDAIDIWVVLPDDLAERCDEGYLFYNLEQTFVNGNEIYDYKDTSHVYSLASDHESVAPPGFQGPSVPGGCRNLIRCQVLHFSRWEIEKGNCPDPGC
jgi:hypothetical protein